MARQNRIDPAGVIGMAVRQANGGERQPVLLDHAEYGLGMVAGVDEDSLTGGRVVVEIPLDGIAADVAVYRDDVLDRVRDGMARMPPVAGDGGQLGAVEAECCGERVGLLSGRRAPARFQLPQRRRAQTGVPGNLVGSSPKPVRAFLMMSQNSSSSMASDPTVPSIYSTVCDAVRER